jgi:hypothetical protein
MAGRTARWITALRTSLRRRGELLLEFIVLHHQLAVLRRTGTRRPCFRPADRLLWVLLSHLWVGWRRGLMIVQPATVLRWRRQGLRSIWTSRSRGRWRGGRPRIGREIRDLIVRMSRENFLWGAPRIHGELLKLGFDVSQATVSRYMPRRSPLPSQSWCTFLRNQAAGVGIISSGDAGGLSDQLRSLVSGWIEWIVRYAAKMWDGISAPLRALQLGSSRSDNCTRRVIICDCMPICPRSAPSRGAHWITIDRRPSPYRSRASPRHTRPSARSSAVRRACVGAIDWSADTFAYTPTRVTRQMAVAEHHLTPIDSAVRCVDQVLRTHRQHLRTAHVRRPVLLLSG